MKIIGIGAMCAICHTTIRSGETYISPWGPDGDSVHHLCNLQRLGLAKSSPIGVQLSQIMRETIRVI